MLPFDLHVLGLPPAFTLSQDQTLHLNFSDRSPDFLSAVARPSPKLLYCICMLLNLFGSCRTSARWTTIHSPDARTSHLRTLSKIVGIGLSASSRLTSQPAAEASE